MMDNFPLLIYQEIQNVKIWIVSIWIVKLISFAWDWSQQEFWDYQYKEKRFKCFKSCNCTHQSCFTSDRFQLFSLFLKYWKVEQGRFRNKQIKRFQHQQNFKQTRMTMKQWLLWTKQWCWDLKEKKKVLINFNYKKILIHPIQLFLMMLLLLILPVLRFNMPSITYVCRFKGWDQGLQGSGWWSRGNTKKPM